MAVRDKKVFVFEKNPGGVGLFYRLWKLTMLEGPLARSEPDEDPGLCAVRKAVEGYAEQMRRQQVHIDEIKRLCNVPTD